MTEHPAGRLTDPSWLNDRSEFQLNFVHGLRNPVGLHLQYRLEGDAVVTDWIASDDHVGFPGFVHGGLIAAVLDDVMGRSTALLKRWVVTGRQSTRFRTAAPVGVQLRITGRMLRVQRRVVTAAAEVTLPDGTSVATSEGTYLPIPSGLRSTMVEAWPGFADYLEPDDDR